MFDIGWGELVVIGIVALIAIGPKELPTVLRTLGQYMAKIRRMAADFQGQFQEAMREAEMAELKKQAEDLKSSVSDLTKFDPLANTQKEIERAFEMPEIGEASTEKPPAPAALPEPQQQVDVSTALPEAPSPVSEKDFAASEAPPPKQAGGAA
ncbi:MAG TPA: Sec-independent protein translocase protein TatB [Pseudolabrys sp.]|jgi:sec-independent protein translocase protein TatB|nr:Sec-independent protein translocase protein TatB [Pseudolabrys sp.]